MKKAQLMAETCSLNYLTKKCSLKYLPKLETKSNLLLFCAFSSLVSPARGIYLSVSLSVVS